MTDEALHAIITGYTAESGVRGLKRQMDVLCRHAAVKLVKGEQKELPRQREAPGGISGASADPA